MRSSSTDPDSRLTAQLDALSAHNAKAPEHLAARIIAATAEEAQQDPSGPLLEWLAASLWRGAAAAVAPMLIGFGLGVAVEVRQDQGEDLSSHMLADTYEELGFDEF